MPFCALCRNRAARCLRGCEREANGRHLWNVIQDELARIHGGAVDPSHTWANQTADMQQALVVGAAALRSMER